MILDSFTFQMLCGEYCIDPHLVLEHQDIIKAIKNNDYDKVVEILENEF